MTDEHGRNGDGPPTGDIPPAFPCAGSRHDHFPRFDSNRRQRMRVAEIALSDRLAAMDRAEGGIAARMADLALADPDTIFSALTPLLTDHRWVQQRLAALVALNQTDPFAMPPVRIFSGIALGGLILAEAGAITLSLMIRPFNMPPPRDPSVIFSPGHGLTYFVASGGARIRRFRVALSDDELAGGFRSAQAQRCESLGESDVHDGMMIRMDQQRESFNLTSGAGDIVMLQLFVRTPSHVPMREYDPATGRLLSVAAGERAASFRQMGLALLRAFDRRDAAPQFAAALNDPDFAMRWQVMREFIALDTAAALPHLDHMAAADPHPEVRAAAAATLRLVREHMAMAAPQPEAVPCH